MSDENQVEVEAQPPAYETEPLPGQADPPKLVPVVQAPPPVINQPQPTTTTVVVTNSSPSTVLLFGRDPVTMTCPNCKNNITTICEYKIGILVILLMIFLCLILDCWCGCCLIPLCIPGIKDVVHTCPVCKIELGKSKMI